MVVVFEAFLRQKWMSVAKGRWGKQAEKHPRSLSQKDRTTHALYTSLALVQSFIKKASQSLPQHSQAKMASCLSFCCQNVRHPIQMG